MAVFFHHFAFEHLPTSVGYGSTGTTSGLTASLSFFVLSGLVISVCGDDWDRPLTRLGSAGFDTQCMFPRGGRFV